MSPRVRTWSKFGSVVAAMRAIATRTFLLPVARNHGGTSSQFRFWHIPAVRPDRIRRLKSGPKRTCHEPPAVGAATLRGQTAEPDPNSFNYGRLLHYLVSGHMNGLKISAVRLPSSSGGLSYN